MGTRRSERKERKTTESNYNFYKRDQIPVSFVHQPPDFLVYMYLTASACSFPYMSVSLLSVCLLTACPLTVYLVFAVCLSVIFMLSVRPLSDCLRFCCLSFCCLSTACVYAPGFIYAVCMLYIYCLSVCSLFMYLLYVCHPILH